MVVVWCEFGGVVSGEFGVVNLRVMFFVIRVMIVMLLISVFVLVVVFRESLFKIGVEMIVFFVIV